MYGPVRLFSTPGTPSLTIAKIPSTFDLESGRIYIHPTRVLIGSGAICEGLNLKLALLQLNPTVGALEENTNRIIDAVRKAENGDELFPDVNFGLPR